MPKKRFNKTPRLSSAQQESPETLDAKEIERRRSQAQARTEAEKQRVVQRLLNEGARLLHAQRAAEAIPPLRQAHELAPFDADVIINLGGALVMTSKWNQAVILLESAVVTHPLNARLWLNLAAAHLGRLEFASRKAQDKAISAYKHAIEIDPAAANAHYNIGLIYYERKEWAEAAVWFESALSANPVDKDASLMLRRAQQASAEDKA